jgi:hypothetical protein
MRGVNYEHNVSEPDQGPPEAPDWGGRLLRGPVKNDIS